MFDLTLSGSLERRLLASLYVSSQRNRPFARGPAVHLVDRFDFMPYAGESAICVVELHGMQVRPACRTNRCLQIDGSEQSLDRVWAVHRVHAEPDRMPIEHRLGRQLEHQVECGVRHHEGRWTGGRVNCQAGQ